MSSKIQIKQNIHGHATGCTHILHIVTLLHFSHGEDKGNAKRNVSSRCDGEIEILRRVLETLVSDESLQLQRTHKVGNGDAAGFVVPISPDGALALKDGRLSDDVDHLVHAALVGLVADRRLLLGVANVGLDLEQDLGLVLLDLVHVLGIVDAAAIEDELVVVEWIPPYLVCDGKQGPVVPAVDELEAVRPLRLRLWPLTENHVSPLVSLMFMVSLDQENLVLRWSATTSPSLDKY